MVGPMRTVSALLAIPLLSGCALLMPTYMSGTASFTDPAGYRITCSSGPMPIATGQEDLQPELDRCTRIAEDGVETFLAQHPGAKVESVTIEVDSITEICYTLEGTSACVAVPE
jgi:hypothetical protein